MDKKSNRLRAGTLISSSSNASSNLASAHRSGRRHSTHTATLSIDTKSVKSRKDGLPPQYHPETEAMQVQEALQRQRRLPFYSMWRYTTKFDIFILVIGAICTLGCAFHLPFIIYFVGEFIGDGLDDAHCYSFFDNSTTIEPPIKLKLDSSRIQTFIFTTIALGVSMSLLCYAYASCFAFTAENQIYRLRLAYFQSIIRKDMSWLDIYVNREFGSHMTHDITRIRAGLGEKVGYLMYIVAVIIGLIATALYEHWALALLCLCLAPIIGALSYLSSFLENKVDNAERFYTAADLTAEEILSNIKTVKVYEGEEKAKARYESLLQPMYKVWKWIQLSSLASASLWFFVYSSYGVVFFVGGSTTSRSGLRYREECVNSTVHLNDSTDTPGTLFVIFFCVVYAALHMSEIPVLILEIKHARHLVTEVFFMIDWVSRIDNMSTQGGIPSRTAIGKLELEAVSFRYPRRPETQVLHNIRVTIHPGQVVAFFGNAGSGKSTILRLIQRLYDPTSGSVYLDGRNMESLNIGWLRSQIGIVSQEPVLFDKTIEENVRFARWSATQTEVQDACRVAGIHEDIVAMKDGYQTMVGHRGSRLSDIQKRQISFARVSLQNPKIVMLDDPVDSADSEFVETILRAVSRLRESTTIIVAASEMNPIVEQADIIFVLDRGSILERGNHHDLMRRNGIYAAMKNQIFNHTSSDSGPKFISQLTSFRFAQSLRRMHLRKSLASKEETQRIQLAEFSELSLEDHHGQDESHSHATYHGRARQKNNLGMRVAGGLMQYHYARTSTDPAQMKRIYDKGISKIQHETGIHMAQSDVDKSINLMIKDMERHPPRTPPPAPEQGILQQRGRAASINQNVRFVIPLANGSLSSALSTTSFALPLPKTMEADNRSVASKDSEAFWDHYSQVLNNLEGLHSTTSWRDLLKIGLGDWKYVVCTLLMSALMGLYNPIFAIFYGELFGSLAIADNDKAKETGELYCLLLIGLGACATVTAFLQETILSIGGYEMTKRLRKLLFSQILKQNMAWFDRPENDISFLCARLSTDTASVENLLLITSGVATQSISTILATIFLAYSLSNLATTVSVTLIMGLIILIVIYADGILQLQWQTITDEELKDVTALEIEVVTNIRTVITLGLEDHFLAEFLEHLNRHKKKIWFSNQGRAIFVTMSLGLPFIFYIVMILMFFKYGEETETPRRENFKDLIKLGELVIFGVIPVGVGLSLLPNSKASRGAAYRISRILNSKPQFSSGPDVHQKTCDAPPELEVQDLAFAYEHEPDIMVLRSLNFKVKPAGFLALVGPSGSGKSTVISLLLRLYEPSTGCIKFNGENTSTIAKHSMSRITALIEQNPTIFDLTIRENIAYGDNSREVPMEEIILAAVLAEVHEQIMLLDDQYETQVSSLESGHRSFALRQRLVIARAILRNPKLLVIDEATASSDFESDFLLLRALDRCHIDRTTIVASQRIEPIRNADLILVMKNGEIIERGNDYELLSKKGLYFNMYMAQRVVEGYEDNPETFVKERLNSIESDESVTKRRRRRSSVAYNNYLQKRLTNYVPKPRVDSSSSTDMEHLENVSAMEAGAGRVITVASGTAVLRPTSESDMAIANSTQSQVQGSQASVIPSEEDDRRKKKSIKKVSF